ncbi:MAG: PPC domain-containing DNA-binding protein [Thermodesulfobacteriota bacterium]|nr:PPC domain-containing DNA-binding protein [Thermodesulfobacteriota bacterium]
MQYSEARQGRTFILRLEQGEIVHQEIEAFARVHDIPAAAVIAVGGADIGSRLVVGPEKGGKRPVTPMEHMLDGVHEISGTGTLFPDDTGQPVLHMHMACGRKGKTFTGCIRSGVVVWQIMEIVLFEITGTRATRLNDPALGFKLLAPEGPNM